MKFQYDIRRIVEALSYYDIKGLLKLMDNKVFIEGEPSLSEMEDLFIEKFNNSDKETKKEIEKLMLTCARVNSIGF